MPLPIFIFHELLFRIQLFDPTVGSYISHSYTKTGAVIVTSTRTIRIRNGILNKQFKDPNLIPETVLRKLIA
ncbi:hypothetical protein TH53_24860 [Pedobacter lusitanus]|uniref:Uncharacterized protein n=1 Tax=Pedobacter lusitanus TaxID=1503925 RepID=A0A0D0GJY0_9SPHI|nr:hypothetical protein TH53_24860 [Pedobacter lusitanus]